MSRRCRASLLNRQGSDKLDSGCECARLGGGKLISSCIENTLYGDNLLLDSSVEQQLALYDGGPNADEVPALENVINPTSLVWPSDDSAVPDAELWFQQHPNTADVEWVISTTDPHTGVFHFRLMSKSTGSATIINNHVLYPPHRFMCAPQGDNWFQKVYGARVTSGDLVVWSCYAKATVLTGTPQIRLEASTTTADLTAVADLFSSDPDSGTGELELTNVYARYELSFFVPANSYYLFLRLFHLMASSTATYIDVDTLGMSIKTGNITLCAQANLITIDNSTTETDFL